MPSYNANTMILIPKTTSADTMDHFIPIVMENLKFKIISKIIVSRLAKVMPEITSKEEIGFIQGRNIKNCVCMASKAINILDQKSFGGILALKVDISKAFDTLDWNFIYQSSKEVWIQQYFL